MPAVAQTSEKTGQCLLSFSGVPMPSPYSGSPDTKSEAKILGETFEIPELHLRLIDLKTGKLVVPRAVSVDYYWLWLEWPYPEHSWGKWSDAADLVKCTSNGSSELVVSGRTIKPRGWYDGKYTKFPYTLTGSKKPKFDRIEIVFEYDRCAPRLIIDKQDVSLYENSIVLVKLPCGGRAEIKFERRNP